MYSLSQKILSFYEANISRLPEKNIGHFFERASKICQKKYETILWLYFYTNKTQSLKQALEYLEGKKKFSYSIQAAKKKKRTYVREFLYHKKPILSFIDGVCMDWIFLNNFSLDKVLGKHFFNTFQTFLKKINLKQLYLDPETIQKDSSFAVNTIFTLKHFGVCDMTNELEEQVKKLYCNINGGLKKNLDAHEYQSFVYILTHIIIADSKFYAIKANNRSWIFKYFQDHLKELLSCMTIDIIAEMGLCFRLASQEKKYQKTYRAIRNYVLKQWSKRKYFDISKLAKNEHTNSIIMLLFHSGKYYTYPNLSHYAKK